MWKICINHDTATSIFALPKNVPQAHFLNGRLQVRPVFAENFP